MQYDITIHQAVNKESADEIAKLASEIWVEHYSPIIGLEQVEYMIAHFQSGEKIFRDITVSDVAYYQAYCGKKLVGYCAIKQDIMEKSLFLSKLYVEKNYRGKGVAKQFLRLIEEIAQKEEASYVWLTVNKNNLDSITAYQRLGFQIEEEIVTDIGNGFVMDDYRMKLNLQK